MIGPGITDDGLSVLETLPNLRSLYLSNTKAIDKGMAHLAGLRNLEYLVLDGTRITDACFKHFTMLVKVEHLDLKKTNVTGSGFCGNGILTSLRMLILDQSSLDDQGLKCLKGAKSLRTLLARNTKITTSGINQLKEASGSGDQPALRPCGGGFRQGPVATALLLAALTGCTFTDSAAAVTSPSDAVMPWKMPARWKGDSHQIWRTQRVQVNVASLRWFHRSSTGPNRAFEPQSLESLGRVRDPVRIAEGPTAIDAATQRNAATSASVCGWLTSCSQAVGGADRATHSLVPGQLSPASTGFPDDQYSSTEFGSYALRTRLKLF